MPENSVLTIGYGNRSIEEFISLLINNKVAYLIDIRSKPFSRKNEFNQHNLKKLLKSKNISYVFMGDLLGGHPNNAACYDNGRVNYEKLKEQPTFKNGLERLQVAMKKNLNIILMCSESKPDSCHRSKLIGRELLNNNINVIHVDEHGDLVNQEEIVSRITGGQNTIFGEHSLLCFSKKHHQNEG